MHDGLIIDGICRQDGFLPVEHLWQYSYYIGRHVPYDENSRIEVRGQTSNQSFDSVETTCRSADDNNVSFFHSSLFYDMPLLLF
jgi:hypothetical protein